MSQNVIYYDTNLDLTTWVLDALQKQLGTTAGGGARTANQPNNGQVVR
jgi:hypothetical protein